MTELSGQLDFNNFQYRFVGPMRGGRVTTVTGVEAQPNVFYMGATGGGVWKTDDYGTSWKNISDGYFSTPSIGAIKVAKNDPNIIYVGTGSDGLRSNVITGKGVYKSINAGKTWQHIGLKNAGQIGAVEIHPTNHNIAFVAAIGQAFQANKERGVFRTQDGGETWKKVLFLSDTTGFVDLEFMPSNPNIIYAAAWRAERKPWTIISGGQENGIYKTIDGGDTWKKIGKGLPKLMGKIDLAVTAADSKVLYALVEANEKETGLYRSDDQGVTFKHVSNNFSLVERGFYYTNVDVSPKDADEVHVSCTRYFKSTNGGKTWQRRSVPHGDNHDIWMNPNNPNIMIQANDGGANVSLNGGESWSTQFNQSTSELYQIEVDNQYPYWLYGGQQDNYTTISVPSLPPYSHQMGSNGFIMNTGGCETGPAVPNPDNPNIVYANCKGRFSVYNKTTGQEKFYDVGARYMYGHNPKDLKFRFQRVSPIHVSPHDAKVIYHTSQFVHKTTDEGKTWEIISPDLTAFEADKQVRSGAPITNDITGEEFYSTIYAIQESRIEKGLIWVGSNDGPIHMTKDGGKNWKNVTPKSLAKGGRVDCVEPSVHQRGKAYATILRYQLGDWTPYIFKTTNYGKSWKLINKGIPSDYPVRVVREDPNREGLLYAGTEFGMFISFDDGENWQTFQQNLPVTPITDIKVHREDLVLSTMGRGFQILDNVTTLHQDFDKKDQSQHQLFQPRNTYRYRYRHFSRMSSDNFSPQYPRPSVIIDYYLSKKVEGILQLDILNQKGEVIRRFTNKDFPKKDGAERDMATNNVIYTINSELKTSKGMHRFRWDMKHFGAWNVSKTRNYANGPYASTGEYTIRLKIGEQVFEQPFELLTDPRIEVSGVTLSDIQAQEILSLKVVDLLSAANQKANEIKEKIKRLQPNERSEKERLEKIYHQLVRSKGRYTQTKLINQISYLYNIISQADQLPGRDVYERYEELKKELEALD